MYSIAIFGGTFDPIHNAHIRVSLNIQAHFKFSTYLFLPCKIPALKSPAKVNTEHRINMIELAIKNYPEFKLDLREVERDSPSYMVETLKSFREEFPEASLTLIIGYDAFMTLPHWHQWEKLITFANLLIIDRNQFSAPNLPKVLKNYLQTYQSTSIEDISQKKAGQIAFFNAGDYEISSTKIRNALKKNKDVSLELPIDVYQYIKAEGLYQ